MRFFLVQHLVVFTFPTFGGFIVLLQCQPRIFSNDAFQGFYNFLPKVGMDVIVIIVIIIIRFRRANQWWLRATAQSPRPKFHHALQVALRL